MMTDSTERINRMFREAILHEPGLAAFLPRTQSPNYRYFRVGQVQFCWNTTPADERDGKWFAWEYRPVGPGARTGKATRWEMTHRTRCGSRAAAKAKALAWYQKAKRTEPTTPEPLYVLCPVCGDRLVLDDTTSTVYCEANPDHYRRVDA